MGGCYNIGKKRKDTFGRWNSSDCGRAFLSTGRLQCQAFGYIRLTRHRWLLLACPWLLQAAYCARVGTSRGKKCESEYTSRKKVQNIPPKYEKKGRAHHTFDKLSLQVLKKGAGARYIRHFLSSRVEKRGGRTIHSTNCPFRSLNGVPQWGGTHGEPRRGRFLD